MRTVEVTDELQEYMDGLLPKRDRVLARMEEEAHRENIPIVDAHEGMLLYLLVKIAGAKRILLPMASVKDIPTIPGELFAKFQTSFYADPTDAVFKALGVQ